MQHELKLSQRSAAKLNTLKYMSGLSEETQEKMKDIRASFYRLAAEVLALGESRETSEAFTHIEAAQAVTIKHLCLIDPQAVKEPIKGCDDSCTGEQASQEVANPGSALDL